MAALDFRGQTVWVTGAGKGIGYATALAFVEAGANVTGFDLAFDGESYPFATETLDVADAAQAFHQFGVLPDGAVLVKGFVFHVVICSFCRCGVV